jgi:hypothetical protein
MLVEPLAVGGPLEVVKHPTPAGPEKACLSRIHLD